MPIRSRQATAEDLAQMPTLLISFGTRPQPEPPAEPSDKDGDEDEEGA